MDSQTSEPPSGRIMVAPEPMNGNDAVVTNQRGSAIRHLAILSTLLSVPIALAFLPYMVTRRQVTTLSRKLDEMGATTALLQRRLALEQVGPGMESESGAALLRQEMEAMRQQFESREFQRTKFLSDMTLDVTHINEELDKVKGDVLANASNPRLATVETSLRSLEDGVDNIRQHALDVQEQIRLLRGEQEALRSELFKLSDEVQSVKTGPQNSELQKLLLDAKQTRLVYCCCMEICCLTFVAQRYIRGDWNVAG